MNKLVIICAALLVGGTLQAQTFYRPILTSPYDAANRETESMQRSEELYRQRLESKKLENELEFQRLELERLRAENDRNRAELNRRVAQPENTSVVPEASGMGVGRMDCHIDSDCPRNLSCRSRSGGGTECR